MTERGVLPPPGRGVRFPRSRWIFIAALAALTLIDLGLLVRSLDWPLTLDAALMHYVGWRIDEGDAPYRDLFDMNFPGTYLIHLFVVRLLGTGDAAWRAFDLAWLAAATVLLYRLAPGRLPSARACAALLYPGYHLAIGRGGAGERDFFLAVLLLAAAERVAAFGERGGRARLVLAGLAAGAAATIKPTAALMAAALAVITFVASRRRGEAATVAVLAFAASWLIPVAAVLGWLGSRGALPAFAELALGFTLTLYPRLLRLPLLGNTPSLHLPLLTLMAGLAVGSLLLAYRRRELGPRHAVLAAGIVFAVLHYLIQRKGFSYHLIPLAAFTSPLVPSLARAEQARERTRTAAALALAAVVGLIAARGLRPDPSPFQARTLDQVSRLEVEIARRIQPGDRVQVFDTAQGAIHALLRLRVRQPTRFLYDFPLLVRVSDPQLEGYQSELLAGLARHPPALMIVTEHAGGDLRYARLTAFPALGELLSRRYRLDLDAPGFRIYARREPPGESP